MPFADQAIKRLTFEIHHSRAMGCTVLKIMAMVLLERVEKSGQKAENISHG